MHWGSDTQMHFEIPSSSNKLLIYESVIFTKRPDNSSTYKMQEAKEFDKLWTSFITSLCSHDQQGQGLLTFGRL